MLKKLLKYEFKAVSKTLVPMLLGIFGISLLSSVMMLLNNLISRGSEKSALAIIFSVISGTITVFSVFLLFASIFILIFMLLSRYYKNLFTDEGYLTFTLPVQTKELLVTKLISGFVWTVIGAVVIVISAAYFLLFVTAKDGRLISFEVLKSIFSAIKEFYAIVGTGNGVLYTLEILLMALCGLASQLLLYYLAITMGSIIAKKHKILASIGMYFAINTVTGTVSSLFMVLVMLIDPSLSESMNSLNSMYTTSHYFFWSTIVIYLAMGTVSYLICKRLLTKKLNLE